jgi:hypothetical protein
VQPARTGGVPDTTGPTGLWPSGGYLSLKPSQLIGGASWCSEAAICIDWEALHCAHRFGLFWRSERSLLPPRPQWPRPMTRTIRFASRYFRLVAGVISTAATPRFPSAMPRPRVGGRDASSIHILLLGHPSACGADMRLDIDRNRAIGRVSALLELAYSPAILNRGRLPPSSARSLVSSRGM